MKKTSLLIQLFMLATCIVAQQGQLSKLIPQNCGKQNVKAQNMLHAKNIQNANSYEFEIANPLTGQTDRVVSSSNEFMLNDVDDRIDHDSDLDVKIRVDKGSGFGNWGQVCKVKTIKLKEVKLKPQFCDANNISEADVITFFSDNNATHYNVYIEIDSIGSDTITVFTNSFSLSDFVNLGYINSTDYKITIQSFNGNIAGPIGKSCYIQTIITNPTDFNICERNCSNMIGNPYFNIRNSPGNIYTNGLNWPQECWTQSHGTPKITFTKIGYTLASGSNSSPSSSSEGLLQTLPQGDGFIPDEKYLCMYKSRVNNNTSSTSTFLDEQNVVLASSNNSNLPNFNLPIMSTLQSSPSLVGKQLIYQNNNQSVFDGWVNHSFCFVPGGKNILDQIYFYPKNNRFNALNSVNWDDFFVAKLADAGEDVRCEGKLGPCEPFPISLDYTIDYLWSPSAGLDDPTSPNPFANPTSPTTYTLTVTYNNLITGDMCSDFDKVKVTPDSYNCCLDKEILRKAVRLREIDGPFTSANLPFIDNNSTVILDGDVVFQGVNINWREVKVYAESYYNSNDEITGSSLTLENCGASFEKCTFQAACDKMWEGIVINTNENVEFKGCNLNDAFKAINIKSFDNILRVTNNNFSNNYYGVVFDNEFEVFKSSPEITINDGNIFDSNPNDMLWPYNGLYSQAHFYVITPILDLVNYSFNKNSFNNCIFGITAPEGSGAGMNIHACNFTNFFVGAFYDGFHNKGNVLEMKECDFYFPNFIPNTTQTTPYNGRIYGIHRKSNIPDDVSTSITKRNRPIPRAGRRIVSLNNNFYSANSGGNYPVFDIGISSNEIANLKAENCFFNDLKRGIEVRAFGAQYPLWTYDLFNPGNGPVFSIDCMSDIEVKSRIDILGCTFTDNKRAIHYMNNQKWVNILNQIPDYDVAPAPTTICHNGTLNPVANLEPTIRTDFIEQNITCNDFVKSTNSGNTQLTAIYVQPNTLMNDLGNCNTQPAGNEILDPTNTMRSIWNLGSGFDYTGFQNENLNSMINGGYPHSGGVNFLNQSCGQIADDNTCIGTPGILNRPINGNGTAEDELDKVGFSADTRYKNNTWFTESTLGDALPNPATNQVIIPVIVSEESRSSKIIIYNSIGAKPLVEQNVSDNGEIQLDVSNLASGMYFYSLMVNGAIVDTKKLIIKK